MPVRLTTRLYQLAAAWAVIAIVITLWDWEGRWHMPYLHLRYKVKLWVYWAQWAALPLLPAALHSAFKGTRPSHRVVGTLSAIGCALVIWSGMIEVNWLRVRHTEIHTQAPASAKPIRIALVADLHWGLFVRDWQIQRIANALAKADVDVIAVAGDWTYDPKLDLQAGFAAFAHLGKPVLAVMGNHDLQEPGPRIAAELRQALQANGVQLIEGRSVTLLGWDFVGLDDLWGGHPRQQIAKLPPTGGDTRIVITHQPDTLAMMPPGGMQLGLAGHTHGGQIDLPMVTGFMLRHTLRRPWYNGLYKRPEGAVFVTPGTGVIGLPWRFRVRPTIDILHVTPKP